MRLNTSTLLLGLLFVSSLTGFITSYFPGVWGEPLSFWVSDLIATVSYFTIISNLLIALMTGAQLFAPDSKIGLMTSTAMAQTALAVYITITGLVYHLLLADTWNPTGISKVSDELLHTVTPILYVVLWWVGVRGKVLRFRQTVPMLLVPLLFLAYWLVRGPLIGQYPYFFMDINEFGAIQVGLNMFGLCLLFWIVAVVYWALNRYSTPLYV